MKKIRKINKNPVTLFLLTVSVCDTNEKKNISACKHDEKAKRTYRR
jgi:hypothetical protein